MFALGGWVVRPNLNPPPPPPSAEARAGVWRQALHGPAASPGPQRSRTRPRSRRRGCRGLGRSQTAPRARFHSLHQDRPRDARGTLRKGAVGNQLDGAGGGEQYLQREPRALPPALAAVLAGTGGSQDADKPERPRSLAALCLSFPPGGRVGENSRMSKGLRFRLRGPGRATGRVGGMRGPGREFSGWEAWGAGVVWSCGRRTKRRHHPAARANGMNGL